MALTRRRWRKAARQSIEPIPQEHFEQPAPRADEELRALMSTLARRQMALTYHLIRVLDKVEREAVEPDTLRALYAVDHDANRLRRYAEGLLLLAGGQVCDGLEGPVTLMDVARAAQCASADFEPVKLTAMPAAAVPPGVSDDLVHLLAALLDNAISYAPASSRVTLSGHSDRDGSILLQIADCGLGIERAALAELNARLAAAPVLDARSARQMGLYVVASIAHRHGLYVQLAPRPGGGTIAYVTLPGHLIISPEAAAPAPAAASVPAPVRSAPPSGDWWGVQTLTAPAAGTTKNGLPRRTRAPQASGPWLPTAPPARPPDPQSVREDLDDFEAGEQRARTESAATHDTASTSWEGPWQQQ